MAAFSWSDTIHIAFSTCLPCFSSNSGPSSSTDSLIPDNPTAHNIRRARADELEGLLADVLDTDTEAERMSLHSNPGRRSKRSKRKRKSDRRITLFGYDLFGKPVPPPIHLPESDDEDTRLSGAQTTRSSSQTFDSDAAPLDSTTIANISNSSAQLQERAPALEAEAEERRQKQERRERRRERKEMKKVAKALALSGGGDADEFEGFQGSGGGGDGAYPRIPSPMYPQGGEEYGPFVRAHAAREKEDDDDAGADLDGGLYARRNYNGTAGSGSDSRSRTSASRSDQYFHPQSHAQLEHRADHNSFAPSGIHTSTEIPRKKKSKSKKSQLSSTSGSKKSRSNTSASTSQSPSLPSPVSASFSTSAFVAGEGNSVYSDRAPGGGEFPREGFGGGVFPSPGFGGGGFPSRGFGGGGFPSSGFAAGDRENGKRRDSVHAMGGAFLATRGGDIDG